MSALLRSALALAIVTASAAVAQDQGHADDHAGHDHGQAASQAHDHSSHEHGPADQANPRAHEQAGSHPTTGPASQPTSQPTTAPAVTPEASGPVTNATCPVMGQPINERFHATYQGKTVYFCCPACIGPFNSNPERYLSQLPQFSDSTN